MTDYKLGVIGGGAMAEAILRGVIDAGQLAPETIVVSEPQGQRRSELSGQLGVSCEADNAIAASCPCVMLAVKPQVLAGVVEGIAQLITDETVVISIAAGVTTEKIDGYLAGRGRIVRVMPNTPILVGSGVSALSAGPRSGEADLAIANDIFSAGGKTCQVDESLIDAVTAVSGSGPAYFFYMIEAMIDAGVAEGLDAATASKLAVETCAGAAKLLQVTGESPQALRAKVTSKGGTTQRAIETMDSAGVKDAIFTAVRAAAARSRELSE